MDGSTYYDYEPFNDHMYEQQPTTTTTSTTSIEHKTSPKITHLICADGQSISLNNNIGYYDNSSFDANADPFTVSDDVLFRGLLSTIIYIEWQTSPEFASIRVHSDNRVLHVPLCDLQRIEDIKVSNAPPPGIIPEIPLHLRREQLDNGSIRRSIKLNDESLMKLPHLRYVCIYVSILYLYVCIYIYMYVCRKHREYLKTIDINLGPKDYNSYRVSVNSQKANDKSTESKNRNGHRMRNGNQHSHNLSKRADVPFEKSNLFKTELCENFMKRGRCTYGAKCHFAHGRHDIRNRWRIENYKTQPCCDPARAQSRLCLFGKRCNYAHPGEPLRRPMSEIYLDEEYTEKIVHDYGFKHPFPFGIYI